MWCKNNGCHYYDTENDKCMQVGTDGTVGVCWTEKRRRRILVIKFIKQLLCKHQYELNRWHICHGPTAMDPAEIEAEYICLECGKVVYGHYNISRKQEFEKICKQYVRRMK